MLYEYLLNKVDSKYRPNKSVIKRNSLHLITLNYAFIIEN